MIMHCGKKSHKRNQYEYSTAISRHLKLHLKRDLGQKSNKCAQCDYSTNNVGHLKRHQIIHIKEKQTPSLHICLFRCKWLTQDNLTYDKNGLCPSWFFIVWVSTFLWLYSMIVWHTTKMTEYSRQNGVDSVLYKNTNKQL